MDRRSSLRWMGWGTLSAGVLLHACKNVDKDVLDNAKSNPDAFTPGRMVEEELHDRKLMADQFLTPHEMATIAVLCDIIIPADDVSGSATDAKVPDFIEFMVKEKPEFQVPLRGGIKWMDMHMMKEYNKTFIEAGKEEQIKLVDKIAYPDKAASNMKSGVAFFSLVRNLTASGFYTTAIGVKDVGYIGNAPNNWNGVPDDVLKQYGLSYTEKELKECVSFDVVKDTASIKISLSGIQTA